MQPEPKEKLPFFIDTYPDELWCSVIGRLHRRLAYSWSAMCRLVYDTSKGPDSFGLPTGFERFVSLLPDNSKVRATDLIESHTLLPLYRPFLPDDQLKWWIERMHGTGNIITFQEPQHEKRLLKFCGECMDEDRHRSITPYWRRSHNSPRVKVCTRHECYLQASSLKAPGFEPTFPGEIEFEALGSSTRGKDYPIHLAYAKICESLLRPDRSFATFEQLKARYLRVMEDRGTTGKQAMVSELSHRLTNSPLFLVLHASDPPDIWVECALYPGRTRKGRPFHHFALSDILGLDLSEIISPSDDESLPMLGIGPTPTRVLHSFRDEVLVKEVQRLAKLTQPASEKPERRTRHWFLCQIRVANDVEKGRLPKTLKALAEVEESLVKFNHRYLRWIGWDAPVESVEKFKTKRMIRNNLARAGERLDDDLRIRLDEAWEALSKRRHNFG